MFVEVAVNIPSEKTFIYDVPEAFEDKIAIGKRVLAPFGRKKMTGYIVGVSSLTEREGVKGILDVLDEEPLFSEDDLRFYRWAADYYMYPLGKALGEILPARPELKPRKETSVSLASGWKGETRLSKKESEIVRYLEDKGETGAAELRREFNLTAALLKRMEKKGIVIAAGREVVRRAAEGPVIGMRSDSITLNSAQETALKEILSGLQSKDYSVYLLHGVTGSGKTEVYLRALCETLRLGGSAIFLVPEIALTPQLLSRISERFQRSDIAVLHSGVPTAVRYDQWRKIGRGDARIIVGARSAVFAPARNLKLIIVDEEHDGSYKQDERMRYNARDLAVVKARFNGAAVVLGSATPGMQTFFNAGNKKYRYLTLPDRAGERPLPDVEILDMRSLRDDRGKPGILSPPLLTAIRETLEAGRQTLLFLNRRGFHTFVFCADCGHVLRCLNCSVSMTYHAGENILKCHYCDFAVKAPPICPACRGSRVRSFGMGTERLEEEISRAFPGARVRRMDSDSTARKGVQEKILQAFDKGEIDILVGTQMITKGHDYPGVLLVGVVMADASLNIPDFRASECTFQHLTQVAGRGGRGDDPGRVIIQTLNPEHYAIRLARNHDYLTFYEEEIVLRRTLGYPPYSRMVKLNISSTNKERVEDGAKKIGEMAKTISGALAGREKVDVMGPAEAPIAKLKGRYRWQLLLKGKNIGSLHGVVKDVLAQNREKGLEIRVDVDPLNFM
jgi:primosomal protein N' (replication factor Y)